MSRIKRAKATLVISLTLGFLSLGLAGSWTVSSSTATPAAYTLYGTTTGWGLTSTTITSPGPDLTTAPGEIVTVTLHSEDGVRHNFSVDYNGNGVSDPDEPLSADFGGRFPSPISYEFTATTTPGTYMYYCLYHAQQFGSFIVSGSGGNNPPILAPIGSQTVAEGTLLTLATNATDSDSGQTLTFSLGPGSPQGASITPSGVFSWTPTEAQGPLDYALTIIVTDDGSPPASDSETLTISVSEVNGAPSLVLPGDQVVNEQVLLVFPIGASDPDIPANLLSLTASSLPLGTSFPATTGTGSVSANFTWTPAQGQAGTYKVAFTVADNGTSIQTVAGNVTITVLPLAGSAPPALDPISSFVIDEGSSLGFMANATDADSWQTLTFSLGPGAPAGVSFTPGGVFSWTPSESQGGSVYTLTIVVTDDGSPPASDSETFTITVNEVNSIPDITLPEVATVDEGSPLTFTVTATDTDIPSNSLTISSSSLPLGSSFSTSSGTGLVAQAFTWTPDEIQGPGDFTVSFTAADSGNPPLSETRSVTVHVNEVNRAPILNMPFLRQDLDYGITLTFSISGLDPDLPSNTLTFSVTGLPEGAAFDPATRIFSFTPTRAQSGLKLTIIFSAWDNGTPSLSTSKTMELTVGPISKSATTESGIANWPYLSETIVASLIGLFLYATFRSISRRKTRTQSRMESSPMTSFNRDR